MSVLTLARLTIRETQRRRILWIGALMGVAFLLIFGLGFHFIYQDITEIVKRLPFYTRYVAKAVTDADALKSKLTGAGKDKPKCKMFVRDRKTSQPPEEIDPKAKDLKQLTEFMVDVIHEAEEDL